MGEGACGKVYKVKSKDNPNDLALKEIQKINLKDLSSELKESAL